MDSSLYLYERVTQPSSASATGSASATLPLAPSAASTLPLSAPILAPSPAAALPASAEPIEDAGKSAPRGAAPPPASALRDLDKCVDELLQIATEKQGNTEAEQALLIEKLKAYIDAQKKQGEL